MSRQASAKEPSPADPTTSDPEESLLTPEAFGIRLQQAPPASLELPDGVTLTGASLAGFLESGHFPYGRYRVGEQAFFVLPSPRMGIAELAALVRNRSGQRPVGDEFLVWRPTSFRVAAGSAADAREARPFVAPNGARAFVWLGRGLPGGPLVLRDANGVEERVPIPEAAGLSTEAQRRGEVHGVPVDPGTKSAPADQVVRPGSREGVVGHPVTRSAPPHPGLRRAMEALRAGDLGAAERELRAIMASPNATGEALAGAGRLWEELGRRDAAGAAFTLALERGCVEGALGLSQLAEAAGEDLEAAARPLDAAVARNLRSSALHARYAELLARIGHELQAEWHRQRAAEG